MGTPRRAVGTGAITRAGGAGLSAARGESTLAGLRGSASRDLRRLPARVRRGDRRRMIYSHHLRRALQADAATQLVGRSGRGCGLPAPRRILLGLTEAAAIRIRVGRTTTTPASITNVTGGSTSRP